VFPFPWDNFYLEKILLYNAKYKGKWCDVAVYHPFMYQNNYKEKVIV